ncbi:hypothetical protein [Actinoplanes sp. L3-i22]|uniref:TolB family protein n=1 Tax=Actinoplanes sp. L3-i22 TaxID=2836373 RepID=UPI001C758CE9|nr:hypothetical protein [Actinoplanes sp. L3-i22]BCY15502.1 hypothetical protein L3i22_105900 [Actinoplanes sp. L3-i22]
MRATKTVLIMAAAATIAGLTGCAGNSKPAASPAAPAVTPGQQRAVEPVANVTALNGTFFYMGGYNISGEFFSVQNGKKKTVAADTRDGFQYYASVSPDGKHVAYLGSGMKVVVSDVDGRNKKTFAVKLGLEAHGPAWTADSTGVIGALAAKSGPSTAGVVRIADGRFIALPKSVQGGYHYRMSGDGKRIFWVSSKMAVYSAAVDGSAVRRMPVFGLDTTKAQNPKHLLAGDLGQVDFTGSRVTVAVRGWANTHAVDALGADRSDTLVDTATGQVLPLPLKGYVLHVMLLPDGSVLTLSGEGDSAAKSPVFTLFSKDLKKVLTQPTKLGNNVLRDYRM